MKKVVALLRKMKYIVHVNRSERGRGPMAVSVFDVACYILKKTGSISTWKLQKLCYYSQAWALAWSDNKPLFQEDFEAWTNGPVCRPLFAAHSGKYTVDESQFPNGSIGNLGASERTIIDAVLDFYGDKDPYWLREQTHSEKPWREARGNLPENAACSNIISKDSMGRYYGSL